MSPNDTSMDMKVMLLPTAHFASNRTKDADVNIESYVNTDFANSVNDICC